MTKLLFLLHKSSDLHFCCKEFTKLIYISFIFALYSRKTSMYIRITCKNYTAFRKAFSSLLLQRVQSCWKSSSYGMLVYESDH